MSLCYLKKKINVICESSACCRTMQNVCLWYSHRVMQASPKSFSISASQYLICLHPSLSIFSSFGVELIKNVCRRCSKWVTEESASPHSSVFHPNPQCLSKKGPPFHSSALKPLIRDPAVSPSKLSPTARGRTYSPLCAE